MVRLKKLVGADYLSDVPKEQAVVNEHNKGYIERFVLENYGRLSMRFSKIDRTINSTGFGALDKLNETLLSLLTDPDLYFSSWEEAERFLLNKFTEKAMRISVKKPTSNNEGSNEEDFNVE